MGGPSSGRGLSGRVIWVAAAFAALLAVTVVLAMEVRALRPLQSQVRRLRAFPHPGEWVPTVTAVSITGDSVVVGETTPGRAQLLVFFTTTCEFCKASLDSWKEISAALAADSAGRFDVLWISASNIDSTKAYAERHGIVYTIVKMPNTKWIRAYGVKGVPMTLLLNHWGRIAYVHPSVFDSRSARDSVVVAAGLAAALDTARGSVSDSLSSISR